MIVVDTSAVLDVLTGRPVNAALGARLIDDGDLHAPHLIDIEMLHALRRLVHTGQLPLDRATEVRSDFRDLTLTRYPHEPLADRIWSLRHNVTAYDAAFVALADVLGVALVTTDARLARATPAAELFTQC